MSAPAPPELVAGRRLDEANYNTADVESILDHAREMVTSTLESELAFLSHTQALLVRQLMTQAEIKQVTPRPLQRVVLIGARWDRR